MPWYWLWVCPGLEMIDDVSRSVLNEKFFTDLGNEVSLLLDYRLYNQLHAALVMFSPHQSVEYALVDECRMSAIQARRVV